jgi:sugar phosphate isomerase/epimerase
VNYQSLPLEEACRRISALGFEAIDIWDWPNCLHLQSAANEYGAEGFAKLLEKYKLELCGISVYSTSFSKYAPLLGALGGGNAVRGTRGRTSDNLTQDWKKFLEDLKPDLELCEEHNSWMLVENHSGNSLFNFMDSFKALLDLELHPRLGIALAPYHILHNKESVADAIRLCGDRMRFIYLWTNESDEKQLPGLGTTEVADWFKALEEIKYSHYWTPFMHWEPEPDRMDELHRQSLEFLRKYINP